MLFECFHCTVGLEQPSSTLFDNNKVVNGPKISLPYRRKLQKTVELNKPELDVETKIVCLVLDLPNGIYLTASSSSRYNLHNIAQTPKLVEILIENDIFSPVAIAVLNPYREYNARCCFAMIHGVWVQFFRSGKA